MVRRFSFFLPVFLGILELCWVYSLLSFFTDIIDVKSFPFFDILIFFMLVIAIYKILGKIGLLRIFIALVYSILIILLTLKFIHFYYYFATSFYSFQWFSMWIKDLSTGKILFYQILIFFSVLFIFTVALLSARRKITIQSVYVIFDITIGIILFIFLLEIGIKELHPSVNLMFLPCLIIGLICITLVRNQRCNIVKKNLKKREILSFIMILLVILVVLSLSVIIFYPWIYIITNKIVITLNDIFKNVILFLLGDRSASKRLSDTQKNENRGTVIEPDNSGSNEPNLFFRIFIKIFLWLIYIVCSLAVIFIFYSLIKNLFKWLFKKSEKEISYNFNINLFKKIFAILLNIFFILIAFFRIIFHGKNNQKNIIYYFRFLLFYGKFSGHPILINETPNEYGLRLAGFNPVKKDDIFFIINNFNRYTFGKIHLDENSLKEVFKSCIKVISLF